MHLYSFSQEIPIRFDNFVSNSDRKFKIKSLSVLVENQNNDFYQKFAGPTSRKRPNPLQPPRDGETDCTAMSPSEFQNLISAGALSTLID